MDLIDTELQERPRAAAPAVLAATGNRSGAAAGNRGPGPGRVAALEAENRRLREAAAQMQAEIAKLNTLLEPLHALTEQLEHQRRRFDEGQALLRADLQRQDAKRQADWQRREGEMLASLYRRDKELQLALQRRAKEEAENLAQERAGWDRERQRWSQDRESWSADREQWLREQQHWMQQHEHYAALVADLERRLRDVYASTSWLVSRPLRIAGRLVKGLRR